MMELEGRENYAKVSQEENGHGADEVKAPMNIYGGAVDFLVRWSQDEFQNETASKKFFLCFNILTKLWGTYCSQFTIMLFLGDIIKSTSMEHPARRSVKRFANTKAGVFLGIFAMAVFGALANWSVNIKIFTRGQYSKGEQTVDALNGKAKIAIMVFVLIPEFVAFVAVLFRGSIYLLMSPDLETLILNSTALVFLTEISSYVYNATSMPPEHKKLTLKAPESMHKVQDSMFNLMVIVLVSNWDNIMLFWIFLSELGAPHLIWTVRAIVLLLLVMMILVLSGLEKYAKAVLGSCFVGGLLVALCIGSKRLAEEFRAHQQMGIFIVAGSLFFACCIAPALGACSALKEDRKQRAAVGLFFGVTLIGSAWIAISVYMSAVVAFKHLEMPNASAKIDPTYPVVAPGVWKTEEQGVCAAGLLPCETDSSICVESKLISENVDGVPLWTALYAESCPAIMSELNCTEVGFPVESDFGIGTCHQDWAQGHAAYFESKATCGALGARLCTLIEVELAVQKMSSHNSSHYWTGTPCLDTSDEHSAADWAGYWQHVVNGTPVCASVADVGAAMCCADDQLACNPNTGGTCMWSSCAEYRGPTDCVLGQCLCKSGNCPDADGVCKRHAEGTIQHLARMRKKATSEVEAKTSRKLMDVVTTIDEWSEMLSFIEEKLGADFEVLYKDVLVRMILSPSRDSVHAESLLIAWRSYSAGHGRVSILRQHWRAVAQGYQASQ